MEKKKVLVTVAPREGFHHVNAIGKRFAVGGPYEVDVTEEEYEELKARANMGVGVMEAGSTPLVAPPTKPVLEPKGKLPVPPIDDVKLDAKDKKKL